MEPVWVPVEIERPEGRVSFRAEVYEEAGRIVCGIYRLEGQRVAGPHAFVDAVREEMTRFERVVRSLGAEEVRIGGRWGRHILSDYEPFPDPSDPLRRRKIF